MERTKLEWEEIIGHNIRNDTYLTLERIQKNESYQAIIKDLDSNREKYDIKQDYPLVKLKTIKQYLTLINYTVEEEKEIRKDKKDSKIGGIYGIFEDDKIIYIGQTKCFRKRFNNHKSCFNDINQKTFLYNYMRKSKKEGHNLYIKPIISTEDMNVKHSLTTRDLEAMELAFITLYKPICNYRGVKEPYKFTVR